MKKLFISQPMKDKTEEEILKERNEIIAKVKEEFGDEEVEVLDTYFQSYTLEQDNLGNIITMDVPSYNIINENDSRDVARAKELAQFEQYTQWNSMIENAKPLWYLAKSIEMLSKADIAAFAKGWDKYRGCKIEHECAVAYEIPILMIK